MVDDFIKLLLAITVSVSFLGISIQIIRLLGTANDILSDFRNALVTIAKLVNGLKGDYGKVSGAINELAVSISALKNNLIDPFGRAVATVGGYVDAVNKKLRGDN